jgi:hypothetical protein
VGQNLVLTSLHLIKLRTEILGFGHQRLCIRLANGGGGGGGRFVSYEVLLQLVCILNRLSREILPIFSR